MKYLYAYRFVFESPKWTTNLLVAIVCHLVQVVGPIVFLGYGFDMIETLYRRKEYRYTNFDINRIMQYLERGLWPFLVQLVVSLPIALILMVMAACLAVGVLLTPEQHRSVVLGV